MGNWILCEGICSNYGQDGLSGCRGKQRRHVSVSMCVRARARVCFLHVCFTPNNVLYESAGIFSWECYEGHSIGSLCSLHYSIFCHQEHDYLALSLSLSLTRVRTRSHTHTHTHIYICIYIYITSPPFVTNVRTLSSEGKLYLRPSTIPQRHYKASGDKA